MEKLIEGVHRFQSDEFGRYSELFQRLSKEGQNPHTLFITCSDSRILAELITQSQPGDLFVVKNVGNLVPPSSAVGSTNSTAAAIEFAVCQLNVADIVVCGHSQCGAMKELVAEDFSETAEARLSRTMPHLREWLKVAAPVRDLIDRDYRHLGFDEIVDAAGQENVLFAIDNLHTYPAVRGRLEAGTLHVHAWFFKIASAELFAYEPILRQFLPLSKPSEATEPHQG